MISGASVTELTRENAKEMISQNQRKVVSNSLNLLIIIFSVKIIINIINEYFNFICITTLSY